MAIIDLQRGIQEAGRIRIGQQVAATRGGTRPAKLETFRLTSADQRRVEQLAELYGGDVAEWASPNGKQWEVITNASSLDILLPPQELSFSQWYELWSAGGCQRRCDGVTETIGERPCVCDAEARECKPHTRLSVMLRDLPGVGVWRLATQGYYAAIELSGVLQILAMAGKSGSLLPARLRLEQRSVKRPGDNGKPQTFRFAVPMIDVEATPAVLLAGGGGPVPLQIATQPGFEPVPEELPTGPEQSIAEQAAPPAPRRRRANAAPDLLATGRARRARPMPAPEETQEPEDQPVSEPAGEGRPPASGEAASAPAAPTRPRRQAQDAPTRPRRAKPAAEPDQPPEDLDYWMRRMHAAGRERGFDHDDLRQISAAVLGIVPDDIAKFSSKDLVIDEFKMIDSLLRSLPDEIKGEDADADLDALSHWTWPRASAKGLDSWDAIDAVAVSATGTQPDDLTLADWIAFVVRLTHGEYDARQGAA